ncbi:hypothetical protein L365_03521 [Klebsiella pneumoniae MGH 19]|nr:hypothetical protein L365_03521 [Klebsiella pneumoniae MGH 19]
MLTLFDIEKISCKYQTRKNRLAANKSVSQEPFFNNK